MTSPAFNRTAGTDSSTSSAQHEPSKSAWKLMTCSASGITEPAIADAPGDWPTQGVWNSMSKKMAPVNRTARSTSDKTSIPPLSWENDWLSQDQLASIQSV